MIDLKWYLKPNYFKPTYYLSSKPSTNFINRKKNLAFHNLFKSFKLKFKFKSFSLNTSVQMNQKAYLLKPWNANVVAQVVMIPSGWFQTFDEVPPCIWFLNICACWHIKWEVWYMLVEEFAYVIYIFCSLLPRSHGYFAGVWCYWRVIF